jgi:hypothetical protein
MPIVDTWFLVNNSVTPRQVIATGGCGQPTEILEQELYQSIEEYVKR